MTTPPSALADVPDLTKWPLLLVYGTPVTEQQANEIIIRTTQWHAILINDRQWSNEVHQAAGIAITEHGWAESTAVDEFNTRMGVLDLEYLANHRIASAWIGGPHGWCDWNGTIRCANYNIGKYPSVERVWHEWVTLAEAFPFLNITSQLVPHEGADDLPAIEFRVFEGRVSVNTNPSHKILPASELTENQIVGRLLVPGGERGVTADRLRAALDQVRAQRAGHAQ